MKLNECKNWGYFINDTNRAKVGMSEFDMVVVDAYNSDGNFWTQDDVRVMKDKDKLLLAYLSIGEAEDYRWYWKDRWNKKKPNWLGKENSDWKGNYTINSWWDQEWRDIITSCLDHIIRAGFDGVYLDKVDVYDDLGGSESLRNKMVSYISDIVAFCKKRNPKFYIVPQNAQDLLDDPKYVAVIDGIGIEDLYFTGDADGNKGTVTPAGELNEKLALLENMKSAHKPVFVIDYVSGKLWKNCREKIVTLNYIPTCGPRDLSDLRSLKEVWG